MDKIIETANKIKEELYNLDEFKEYFKYKKIVEEDVRLINLRKRIVSAKTQEEHDSLLNEYNNDLAVVNYNHYKNEIADILRTVKNIID